MHPPLLSLSPLHPTPTHPPTLTVLFYFLFFGLETNFGTPGAVFAFGTIGPSLEGINENVSRHMAQLNQT